MRAETIATFVAAGTPFVTAVFSALWAVARTRRADKLFRMVKEESALAATLPDGDQAKDLLQQHITITTRWYVRQRLSDAAIRREFSAIIIALILAAGGISLGWYSIAAGGWALAWNVLAFPLMLIGVVGFFYELSGGKSRETAKMLREADKIEITRPEPDDSNSSAT